MESLDPHPYFQKTGAEEEYLLKSKIAFFDRFCPVSGALVSIFGFSMLRGVFLTNNRPNWTLVDPFRGTFSFLLFNVGSMFSSQLDPCSALEGSPWTEWLIIVVDSL